MGVDAPSTVRSEPVLAGDAAIFGRLFAVLRILTGLVWLSNGLAKLFGQTRFDFLGFFSFTLIDQGSAQSILREASSATQIGFLGSFYRSVVLAHFGIFGILLTIAELLIGLGLLFGIASRLAALGGLLLIGPVWVMLWHTDLYLWEYPAEDLLPLLLLTIAPAGRIAGFDRYLSIRVRDGWPF